MPRNATRLDRATAKERAHKVAQARKQAGITQQILDEQYRQALAKNPLANRSGGRTPPQ